MSKGAHSQGEVRPGQQTGLLRACWRLVIRERCPHCAQGRFFTGLFGVRERCTNCDLRYEASEGAWIGSLALGYGAGALIAGAMSYSQAGWHWIDGIGLDPLWTIAAASLATSFIAYRPAKAFWFAVLYRWDFMAFGDVPPGPEGEP